jgi:hypothetical protein
VFGLVAKLIAQIASYPLGLFKGRLGLFAHLADFFDDGFGLRMGGLKFF